MAASRTALTESLSLVMPLRRSEKAACHAQLHLFVCVCVSRLVHVKEGGWGKKSNKDKCTSLRAPDRTEAYSFITTQACVYSAGTNELTSLVYHLIRREIITQTHKKERETLLQIMLRRNLSICLIDSKIQAA